MCAQYIILSSHFLLLIMDGTKSLEGAKTKKMTEDCHVMAASMRVQRVGLWMMVGGGFFSSKSPMKLAKLGPSA